MGWVLSGGRTPLYLSQKDAYIEKEIKIISAAKKKRRLLNAVRLSAGSKTFFIIFIS
jgi:hypothetical protein